MTEQDDASPTDESGDSRSAETLYSLREVSKLTGAGVAQLRRWSRSGLLPARHRTAAGLWYTFGDIVAARTAVGLIKKGVATRQVREAVEGIRTWQPELSQPLASIRVVSNGGRVVVRFEETLVEPRSGQLLMDLSVGPIVKAMGKIISGPAGDSTQEMSEDDQGRAESWLQAGLAAEQRGDEEVAVDSYRRALSFDPAHPGALLNLGNLLFGRGQMRSACELYRAATRAAPTYPEAWYNLANVLDDLSHADAAVNAYKTAIELEPDYADAHFNLALLWEKEGRRADALLHWKAFLNLDPESPSAEIAREFVEADDLSNEES